jgi:cytochrome P450
MAAEPVPYLSKSSTPKLRKLDSFCKESQRVNPLGHMTFNRKVKKNITLHDGTLLPKGTHLAVASAEIAHDGSNFPDPDTFDPWRFYKLRQQKGHESRHQFVTTGPDSLPFGYGNHACPGRFFANNELKVIFTYVLAHYDIKMPPGEGRPANIPSVGGFRPDTTKSLLMRKRAEA